MYIKTKQWDIFDIKEEKETEIKFLIDCIIF